MSSSEPQNFTATPDDVLSKGNLSIDSRQTVPDQQRRHREAPRAGQWHLVRVGVHGQVGKFSLAESIVPPRGSRVVCRTPRGLEAGIALGPCSANVTAAQDTSADGDATIAPDGRLIRRMTPEDELLWSNLQALSQEALEACAQWLAENAPDATLLEVEPLLDGKTLYFHFLNEVSPAVHEQLDGLVAAYESQVRQSSFAKLLDEGCGPGCGTESAERGCASRGGCSVCKVAICKMRK